MVNKVIYGNSNKEVNIMEKIMEKPEYERRVIENFKIQLESIRRDINAGVVDYANGRNHDAQKEMRRAIDDLDQMLQHQLNDEAYMAC